MKRYHHTAFENVSGLCSEMIEDSAGDWVSYEDYQAVVSELVATQREAADNASGFCDSSMFKQMSKKIAELEAKNYNNSNIQLKLDAAKKNADELQLLNFSLMDQANARGTRILDLQATVERQKEALDWAVESLKDPNSPAQEMLKSEIDKKIESILRGESNG